MPFIIYMYYWHQAFLNLDGSTNEQPWFFLGPAYSLSGSVNSVQLNNYYKYSIAVTSMTSAGSADSQTYSFITPSRGSKCHNGGFFLFLLWTLLTLCDDITLIKYYACDCDMYNYYTSLKMFPFWRSVEKIAIFTVPE